MTGVWGLVLGVLLWLPGSHMIAQENRYCGALLADMLDLVCAERGFNVNKRADGGSPTQPHLGSGVTLRPSALFRHLSGETQGNVEGGEGETRVARSAGRGHVRSVVDECCRQPCSYYVLESYCATAPPGSAPGTEEELVNFFRGTSNRLTTAAPTLMTTSQSTTNYDPGSPSAEILRGYKKPNNFFFVATNVRATRTPLLVGQEGQS